MSDIDQIIEAEKSTPEKITKPKAPGRVAAGKKLAEMNRRNKAKKNIQETESSINIGYIIGGLGVLLAAGSLYLQWRQTKETPVIVTQPTTTPTVKSRIPEME